MRSTQAFGLILLMTLGVVPAVFAGGGPSATSPQSPALTQAQQAIDTQIISVMNARQNERFAFSRARVVYTTYSGELLAASPTLDGHGRAFIPFRVKSDPDNPDRASVASFNKSSIGCYYPDGGALYLFFSDEVGYVPAAKHPLVSGKGYGGDGPPDGRCVGPKGES